MQAPSSHPPSNLLQPSRPTTATHSSDTTSFGSSGLLAPSTSTSPHPSSSPPLPSPGPLVEVHPTFSKYAPLRGTVRIRVEQTVFYAHREVLALASPFFGGVLAGGWKETEPPKPRVATSTTHDVDEHAETIFGLPDDPLHTPQATSTASPPASGVGDQPPSMSASYASSSVTVESDESGEEEEWVECRLKIGEEKASSFQDLLMHIYPRLNCLISWTNVEDLIRMGSKFDIPSLTNACLAFLLPSAAGRPVLCMKIAEENDIPELYKEGSRYTLDNYGNWSPEELAALSPSTLLKLERKRSWFLERLLKLASLGQQQILREYACHAACQDPASCARLVSEKWGSAFSATFRFGTPQPSIIYRSLRSLEPSLSSPALHLPFTSCQNHARLWVADLFDRMFGLGILPARNWTTLTLGGLPAAASATATSSSWTSSFRAGDLANARSSAARYFLFVEMGEGKDGAGEKRRDGRMGSAV
ncbi:hypothetical protein JCM8547_003993 [Rhodosporidiobolus lusitaniae]